MSVISGESAATNRTRVKRSVAKWKRRLLLRAYNIAYVWHDEPRPGDAEDELTYAEVHWGHAGLDAECHIYPAFWGLSQALQDKTILHELGHPGLGSEDEKQVNYFTEVVWRAYEGKKGF